MTLFSNCLAAAGLDSPLRLTARISCVALVVLALLGAGDAQARRKQRVAAKPVIAQVDYSTRDEVREFIREMVTKHGFVSDELQRVFSQIRQDNTIIRLMEPPPAGFKRSWAVYRERFLDSLRQREGARFWQENEVAIRRASEQYGVPEEIIVSIIGVETIFGRITGDFRVLDALTLLGFDYPRRAAYFKSELEQFLLFTRENGTDIFSVRGSFAGAIGLPQFMPGSIRRYAVDFDGDGRIDLRTSRTDAIGSVARFLAEHGWKRGQATHYTLSFDDEQRLQPMIEAGIEPRFIKDDLSSYGVQPEAALPEDMPVALIDLPNGDSAASFYLGTPNFYVITRYNRSSFYAMAVIELSRALRAARLISAKVEAQAGKMPVDK